MSKAHPPELKKYVVVCVEMTYRNSVDFKVRVSKVGGELSTGAHNGYRVPNSLPGYPNTDRVFLLRVCCPLHSALMESMIQVSHRKYL